ncbi:MAG: hypothetical protein AB7R90_08715 [Reyranellaceae bacterium]
MPSRSDAQHQTDIFLSRHLLAALRAVEMRRVPFAAEAPASNVADMACAQVEIAYVHGGADALYRVRAFGATLTMQVQLNAYRFVVLYRVPLAGSIDVAGLEARFGRWQKGAAHVGWQIGWREAADPFDAQARYIEVYCYAMLPQDFLWNELHQLYWRTDIVQMTRAFILEARRFDVALEVPASAAPLVRPASPPGPGRQAAGR